MPSSETSPAAEHAPSASAVKPAAIHPGGRARPRRPRREPRPEPWLHEPNSVSIVVPPGPHQRDIAGATLGETSRSSHYSPFLREPIQSCAPSLACFAMKYRRQLSFEIHVGHWGP